MAKLIIATAAIAALMFIGVQCFGQDQLITKDADTIDCKITSITDDLIYFEVEDSDKSSKVPTEVLHKYLYRMEWETLGALNPKVFEQKNISVQKEFNGSVRTAGFHIERAGKYQMATPFLTLGSVAFTVGGGLQIANNKGANVALISTGCVLGAFAITSQILSARHLRKAGVEFQFIPVNEPNGATL